MFDAITPAVVASEHVVGTLLRPERAARMVEQKALDPTLPGLEDVIDAVYAASFGAQARTPYEAEVKRAVERVVVDELIDLAGSAPMSQVRAIATLKLARRGAALGLIASADGNGAARAGDSESAHAMALASDIKRFLERPATPVAVRMPSQPIPPGAPIGEPAMEWLNRVDARCGWWDDEQH
jgi:hypothetical protein